MSTSRQRLKDLTPFRGRIKCGECHNKYRDCIQDNPVSDLIKHIQARIQKIFPGGGVQP